MPTRSDRRRSWKAAKDKHSSVIRAQKITFKSDLGPIVDKMYDWFNKPLRTPSMMEQEENEKQAKKYAEQAAPVVHDYLEKIKALPDPAKRELKAELDLIHADLEKIRRL